MDARLGCYMWQCDVNEDSQIIIINPRWQHSKSNTGESWSSSDGDEDIDLIQKFATETKSKQPPKTRTAKNNVKETLSHIL